MMRRCLVALALTAGCTVPYEVDPDFDAAENLVDASTSADTTIDDTTTEDTAFELDTGAAIDSRVADARDSAVADTGTTFFDDTYQLDTNVPDTVVTDTFVPDTFVPDTFVPDTFVPDTFPPDTFVTDTFVADTGIDTTIVCPSGTASCDGNPSTCEVVHATAANTCAKPEDLTAATGGGDVCGTTTTTSTTPVTTRTSKFYRLTLVRCVKCSSGNRLRARISLQSPPAAAYDLRIWAAGSCDGAPTITSASGTPGGTETVTLSDLGCASPVEVMIEVRYRAGSSCAPATLTATGAY
jgi:hypothetical protein